jgi:hypothetical protein
MSDPQNRDPQAFWAQLVAEQMARVEGALGEAHKLEGKGAEQARQWVDEGAKLARESLAYSMQLSEQWRKLSMESLQRTMAMVTPKA